MRLIPIFANPDLSDFNNRFGFRPFDKDVGPCAWAWVADGARFEWSEVYRCEMLVEPGSSPRYAHEFYWREQYRDELPIVLPED